MPIHPAIADAARTERYFTTRDVELEPDLMDAAVQALADADPSASRSVARLQQRLRQGHPLTPNEAAHLLNAAAAAVRRHLVTAAHA